jgi:hypothetical protein
VSVDEGGEYLGRYQQGEELPLRVQCVDAAGAPADPAAVPAATVYRDGATPTLLETVALAAQLRGVEVGVFGRPHFLGPLYATAGPHKVLYRWQDAGGVAHCLPAYFTLLPGGDADGAVIALAYAERPDARYLIYQTDGGRLVRGRNPR